MTTTLTPGAALRLLASSRPLSWVNTAYPFALGYLAGGGRVDAVLAVGTLFFLFPYNLLMYGVNDVFDHESDLRNPRKGGVEGIVLDPGLHRTMLWVAGLVCVPFVLALLAVGNPWSSLALVAVLAAVVGYSAPQVRLKERPVLDSLTSSVHFVGPALVGLLMTGGGIGRTALVVLAAFLAWGMASHALGAVQDVLADRSAGIGSVATALGARWTVRGAIALYLVAGTLLVTLPGPLRLSALLVLPYALSAWPLRSLPDAESPRAHAAWRRFLVLNLLAGTALTIGLLIAALPGSGQ